MLTLPPGGYLKLPALREEHSQLCLLTGYLKAALGNETPLVKGKMAEIAAPIA